MAQPLLFANNDQTTLAGSITNTATTATLAAGTGALFPSPGTGQYFLGSFFDAATGLLTEIVKVTSIVGDSIVMVRAQEGTAARAWNANDIFGGFITAGALGAMLQGSGGISLAHGECKLSLSGSNLLLSPYNGCNLIIGGVQYQVPIAGVSLAPTALTPGTAYYIYAYLSGGSLALAASTVGHSADSTAGNVGIEIQTGNNAYTLVGYWLVSTGPAWSSVPVQGIGWFNKGNKLNTTAYTTARTTSSGTIVEINSEIRNTFLTWGSDPVDWRLNGEIAATTSISTGVIISVAFDSATPEPQLSLAASSGVPIGLSAIKSGLSEGSHYATVVGGSSGGTIELFAPPYVLSTGVAQVPAELTVIVRG